MTISLFDSHAHLCDTSFDQDLANVLERAGIEHVDKILIVSETIEDVRKNLLLASEYPQLYPAAGLYPQFAELTLAEEMAAFIRVNSRHLHAIGEVGLDYWLAKEDIGRQLQRDVLRIFVRLAKELGLPLNVHSRSAGRQTIELLLEEGAELLQMHGFAGKASSCREGIQAGYFFSIPPSIVRSRQKQKLVYHLPLENILLESDSPVLGPDPEKRNEPANITIALEEISKIKQIAVEEVRAAISENAARLYTTIF